MKGQSVAQVAGACNRRALTISRGAHVMKLYNRTKLDTKLLHKVLAAAGKAVGARTSKVVVEVVPRRAWGTTGEAWQCCCFRVGKRWIRTDGGGFVIRIPCNWLKNRSDASDYVCGRAEGFFETAMHEWVHIRDFQDGGQDFKYRRTGSSRRMNWKDRPQEQRAESVVHLAESEGVYEKHEELLFELALVLEEYALNEDGKGAMI